MDARIEDYLLQAKHLVDASMQHLQQAAALVEDVDQKFAANIKAVRSCTRGDIEALLEMVPLGTSTKVEAVRSKDSGCADCEKETPKRVPKRQPVPAKAIPRPDKLILLTALVDFKSSYSLTTVIIDQARAAAALGMEVLLVGMENMRETLPPMEGVTLVPGVPNVGWLQDERNGTKTEKLVAWLKDFLGREAPATVLTHDFLLQSWYLTMSTAIHHLGNTIPGIEWYHQMHSSVGKRPPDDVAQFRATVPEGHRMVAVNWSDIPNLARYYDTTPDRFDVLPNIREPQRFLRLSDRVMELVQAMDLFDADILQVFPVSTPRMEAKGVSRALHVFAHLNHQYGKNAKILMVNAHANGKGPQELMQRYKSYVQELQLEKQVAFTSELLPDIAGPGLPEVEIQQLFALSNVFCFPSISEACGLTMLEAAMTGNLLVLNEDLPVLKDFVRPEQALWVPWGTTRNVRSEEELHAISAHAAAGIVRELNANRTEQVRRQILRSSGLRALQGAMGAIWR